MLLPVQMSEESVLQSNYTTTLVLIKEFNLPRMETGSACHILHSLVNLTYTLELSVSYLCAVCLYGMEHTKNCPVTGVHIK